MKTEQMPERIAILTPPGMTEVDFQYFWPTKPCPGGEHVAKDTGHDYAEYVRADATLWDVPKIEAGCWTRLRELSLAEKHIVVAAYIKAVDAGESSLPPNLGYWDHVFIDPDDRMDFVDSVSRLKACLEGIEREVPAAGIIAALPKLLAS